MTEINSMLLTTTTNTEGLQSYSSCFKDHKTPSSQAEAFYLRGQIHERQGDFTSAITDYQHATTINPLLVNALYAKAACQSKLGHYEEAIVTYNQAFALENSDYGAHNNNNMATSY